MWRFRTLSDEEPSRVEHSTTDRRAGIALSVNAGTGRDGVWCHGCWCGVTWGRTTGNSVIRMRALP